ncbi:MAG: aminotransferase class III-fold pyridoxal phosphate-dependent enzyme [Ignavibacteriae bacterium]|nr:aminotransferase class III-fold pyridoxal phosphate-dependent enzyme [Ignavibacteriota bacterium]
METTKSLKEEITQNCLNFTLTSWSKQKGLKPLVIDKAEGVYIYDISGKKIIDFSSQLIAVNIGHGHPKVAEAVAKQMSEVSYVQPGMMTEVRAEVGKKLAEISPGTLNRTFFTLGGAEAVENAIKLARIYTGRHKIVTLYQSYHGATYASATAGGDPRKFAIDSQQSPNFVHVENPYFYRCPWNSKTPEECSENAAAALERTVLYEGPNSIAAIMLEGESGSSGCIKFPPGYWKKVKAIADKYGILTIADEVMSGFGRTGKWFGVNNHEIEPDIMCMAKGITSAYVPLGGIIVKEEIAKTFDDRPMMLGLTYSAHPVSLAAANAVIDIYKDENLIENAAAMGKYVNEKMCDMMGKHPSIGDFRNTGLLGCMELVKNRKTKEPMARWNAPPDEMGTMNKVMAKISELGMFTLGRWNLIFVAPPLCVTKEQIDEGMEIISEALKIADQETN